MLYRNRRRAKWIIFTFIILIVVFTLGCSNLGYYAQSVSGGYEVLSKREPISEVLQDPTVSQSVKEKLQAVLEIREAPKLKPEFAKEGK